jgi:uncharacterized membrane-anchored protein YitT (DUF2179 family)
VGGGIVVKYHGSGGGVEIIGVILKQKFDISVGTVSLVWNIIIVGLGAFIFGFELAMFTVVSMYVSSSVFNYVLEGLSRKRNVMIISQKGHTISHKIMAELGRGVTVMKGIGAYTHAEKEVLLCIVSRFELGVLKEIVREIDPHAFVSITETYEVMGRFAKRGADKNKLPPPALITPEDELKELGEVEK